MCACAAPRLTVRPAAPNAEFRTRAPSDTVKAWQLAFNGDFRHAEQQLAIGSSRPTARAPGPDVLAQGLLDIYHARPGAAEAQFRRVLDSGADSAVRSKAYLGLECLFLSQERYAGLESLESRARREHLESDSTDRFVAQALGQLGSMEVEATSTSLRLPMKLSTTGTPVIRARANGRAPDDFWLDTGASMSGVTESFARKHGVRFIGEPGGSAGTSTSRKVPVRMGVLDSLQVGPLTLRNVPVMVLRDQDLSFKLFFVTLLKIDAIIGWPVISRFRASLDYPQRELTLDYSAAPYEATGVSQNQGIEGRLNPRILESSNPAALRNLFFAGQPCVQVAVDSSGPLNFVLDTGASLSTLTKSGLAKLLAMPRLSRTFGCIGGAGGSDVGSVKAIKAARLTVAGQELYPVSLTVRELPNEGMAVAPDGVLGEDVLRNFKVTIDPRNGMLTLIQ